MSLQIIEAEGRLSPARNLAPEVFIEFDRADDDQILAEIRGGVIEQYVYEFKQSGQTVTGLSLVGVMAVAQQMGGITCGQPVWSTDDHEITCDIPATDHKTGLTVWGTATESRVLELKSGGRRPDKFARSKALSKAQRNAIRKLIPEKLAIEMIRAYRGQGRVAQVGSSEARKSALQPPAPPSQQASEPRADSPAAEERISVEALEKLTQHALTHAVSWQRVVRHAEEEFDKANESDWTMSEGKRLWRWIANTPNDRELAQYEGFEDAPDGAA